MEDSQQQLRRGVEGWIQLANRNPAPWWSSSSHLASALNAYKAESKLDVLTKHNISSILALRDALASKVQN
jgi:hypothetical protein